MTPKKYNFSPLVRRVSLRDLVHYFEDDFAASRKDFAVVIIASVSMGLIFLIFGIYGSLIDGNWSLLLYVLVFILVGVPAYVISARERIVVSNFARLNKLIFLHGQVTEQRHGVIFDQGHSRKILVGLRSHEAGFYELANYQYTTGSGRSSQTHDYGYVCIKLPRRLPNMVLDSKQNNLLGRISSLPTAFDSAQKLSLEGDFDKYFSLYVPKEYERDALYVFTPDIMQLLIDEVGDYDMEVIDDNLYLYCTHKFNFMNQAEMERLFALADKINARLDRQADYYSDERVGDRKLNIVDSPGRRLRRHSTYGLLTLVIIIIALLNQFVVPLIISYLSSYR